jgi:hypothetical protein
MKVRYDSSSVPDASPIFPIWRFSKSFLVIFMGRVWRCFFAGFVLGITHEVGMPLFLVILPLKSCGKAFDFDGFRVL